MDRTAGSIGDAIVSTNTTKYANSYEWDFGNGHFTVSFVAIREEETSSASEIIDIWD